MSEFRNDSYVSQDTLVKSYMIKVYGFMGLALLLTAAVAYLGYGSLISGGIVYKILMSGMGFWVVIIVQLGLAFALGSGIQRFSTGVNAALFAVYAIVTGITFSVLPVAFSLTTIYQAFIYSAVLFGSLVVVGTFTNVDLSRFSGIFMGGLLAIVVVSVLSMFIPALRENMIISYLGLAVFMGLTAWDAQKIRGYAYIQSGDSLKQNLAIYGAFQLYLDFINMFLRLVQILGGTRRRD